MFDNRMKVPIRVRGGCSSVRSCLRSSFFYPEHLAVSAISLYEGWSILHSLHVSSRVYQKNHVDSFLYKPPVSKDQNNWLNLKNLQWQYVWCLVALWADVLPGLFASVFPSESEMETWWVSGSRTGSSKKGKHHSRRFTSLFCSVKNSPMEVHQRGNRLGLHKPSKE